MKRLVYELTAEPRGHVYRALLAAAVPVCDQFLFVDVPEPDFRRDDTSFKARSKALVEELRPDLIEVARTKAWPGTTLSERPGVDVHANVYRFHLSARALAVLQSASDGLYAWRFPTLPADLCLVRTDGDAWLVNIAADEEAYLHITGDEAETLRIAAPGLEFRERYSH
jgi:hypothetical protein